MSALAGVREDPQGRRHALLPGIPREAHGFGVFRDLLLFQSDALSELDRSLEQGEKHGNPPHPVRSSSPRGEQGCLCLAVGSELVCIVSRLVPDTPCTPWPRRIQALSRLAAVDV